MVETSVKSDRSTSSERASTHVGETEQRSAESSQKISVEERRRTMRRMTEARSQILEKQPFYGELLMHLQMGVVRCGTACTDMKHLMFDPDFAKRLSMDELMFVMEHEVLHCALNHCIRGREKLPMLYNIACDIVVNSNIMQTMGVDHFTIDGEEVMHLAPDKNEGYKYSAEQIYEMLLQRAPQSAGTGLSGNNAGQGSGKAGANSDKSDSQEVENKNTGDEKTGDENAAGSYAGAFDDHGIWASIDVTSSLEDEWKHTLQKTAFGKGWSLEHVPPSVREYVRLLEYDSQIDWRSALQDFVQLHADRFDYSFSPSDRRYAGSDFVMPAFTETETEKISNIWFCVDTSGSIDDGILRTVMAEIRAAILQFENIEGKISFFTTRITEPQPFEDEDSFLTIKPQGYGGTNFAAIFQYMQEHMIDDLPVAVIVLTDGQCDYPDEEEALDVPVLWILVDQKEDAPWGRSIHIESNGEI